LVVKKSLLIALCLAAFVPAADAQDYDDAVKASPMNQRLQQIVGVLQTDPNDVSSACIDALKELHKTQDQVTAEQDHNKDQDLEVARDVLESNYEDSNQICGVDAQRMCDHDKPTPQLTQACTALSRRSANQPAD